MQKVGEKKKKTVIFKECFLQQEVVTGSFLVIADLGQEYKQSSYIICLNT